MNSNALRTWLASSGLVVLIVPHLINLVSMVLGCSGDLPSTPEIEVAVCTGGSLLQIPAGLQSIVGGLFIGAALWIKARWGSQGEAVTAGQKLFAPEVPVVSSNEAGVGNVTAADVARP